MSKKAATKIVMQAVHMLFENGYLKDFKINEIDRKMMVSEVKDIINDQVKPQAFNLGVTTTIDRVEKKIIQQVFVVGCASAKREDIGTPKADSNSEYNQGYKDAKNIINKANAQALSTLKQELLGKE